MLNKLLNLKEPNGSKTRILAFIVGLSTFAGFSFVMFSPSIYKIGIFTFGLVSAYLLIMVPVGLVVSFMFSKVALLILKAISNNKLCWAVFISLLIAGFVCGLYLEIFILRIITKTPAVIYKIDTNGDGKVDKWVCNNNSVVNWIKLDTNYDGKPDIIEYYSAGNLTKTEKINSRDSSSRTICIPTKYKETVP